MKVLVVLILALQLMSFASPVFADYPRRIVSGMPSITEMLFALGLEDRIVGVTTNCNYPPQAKRKEKVGGFFLNLEKTVSLRPDLVVMLEGAQKRDIERFKAFGLPVHTINPRSVEEVKKTLLELGDLTGTRKKAEEVVAGMDKRLSFVEYGVTLSEYVDELVDSTANLEEEEEVRVEESAAENMIEIVEYRVLNVKQPQVLVVVGINPLVVVGGETLIDDMLSYAGAQNIAEKTKAAYPQYSFENLLVEDPDYIIFPEGLIRKEEVMKDKRWNSLRAVKKDKILFVNADILSRSGPRVVEAVEQIADFIYQ
jgi:iron complex transport system substrate-binding protein